MEKENKLEKVGNFVSSTLNKIVNAIIVVLIIALVGVIGWFWHNNEIEKGKTEILQKQVEDLKSELKKNEEERKDLKVKNVEVKEVENEGNVVKNDVVEEKVDAEKLGEWKNYTDLDWGISFKYPNDKNKPYSLGKTNNNDSVLILSQEHPGVLIHIRKIDKVEILMEMYPEIKNSKNQKNINGLLYNSFYRDGMGDSYGYFINKNGFYFVFESAWGPKNDIFEEVMKSIEFK